MYYGTPPIVTSGLALHLDPLNPQSIPTDPVINVMYSGSSYTPFIQGLTITTSLSTIEPNSKFRITTTDYFPTYTSGQFRLNAPSNVLKDGKPYTLSFKYNVITGSIFNISDWCDNAVYNVVNTDFGTYKYYSATGVRATYDAVYRFMDFNISTSSIVDIWDIQLAQNNYAPPFATSSRMTWSDLSGNNNTTTLSTGSVTSSIPQYNYLNERVLNFDGTGSYAKGPTTATWFTSSFSIEAWINPSTSPPAQQVFFSGENNIIANTSIHLRVYSYGTIRFGYYADDLDSPANVITFGKWNHVVCTYNSSLDISSIYVNSVLQASGNQGPFTPPTANIFIGQFQATQYFKGAIGTTRVYTKALSQAEVLQNYNASKTRFGLT
jgi:hypothetical protein